MLKKTFPKHAWHKDAKKLIREAEVIVYAYSKNSYKSKNILWELGQILKEEKCLICFPIDSEANLEDNKILFKKDPNTKEKICLADEYRFQPGIKGNEDKLYETIMKYKDWPSGSLFNISSIAEENIENIDDVDINLLFEQYKLFLGTAESLLERRQNVNSFYISANTALITIAATIFALGNQFQLMPKIILIIVLCIPAILLNMSWRSTLISYGINHRGKMKVLQMIEKKLIVSLYYAEWKAMKNKFSKEKYHSFTETEKRLPIIFIIIYSLIILAGFVAIILICCGIII